jgi:hypothetical protein
VWVRIQRRRRAQRLGILTLVVVGVAVAVLVSRRHPPSVSGPVRISAGLDRPLRPDGSAPLAAVWRVRFEGKELRVYRNALGAVHRCPGSPGCTPDGRGGTLELPLAAAGEYRALVFAGAGVGDGQSLQGDLQAAAARGNAVEISPPVVAY